MALFNLHKWAILGAWARLSNQLKAFSFYKRFSGRDWKLDLVKTLMSYTIRLKKLEKWFCLQKFDYLLNYDTSNNGFSYK